MSVSPTTTISSPNPTASSCGVVGKLASLPCTLFKVASKNLTGLHEGLSRKFPKTASVVTFVGLAATLVALLWTAQKIANAALNHFSGASSKKSAFPGDPVSTGGKPSGKPGRPSQADPRGGGNGDESE